MSADARIWVNRDPHTNPLNRWEGNHDYPNSDVKGTLPEVIEQLDAINGKPMFWTWDEGRDVLHGWDYPR